MNKQTAVTIKNGPDLFIVERLAPSFDLASGIAEDTNEQHSACRFITVDADIEHDPNVTAFYTKNGFIPNNELNNKRSKTISMRKDIWR